MSDHGIVGHVTDGGADGRRQALRNVSNLYHDESVATPPTAIALVVNGAAVRFLLAGTPEADRAARMAEVGVRVRARTRSPDSTSGATSPTASRSSRRGWPRPSGSSVATR